MPITDLVGTREAAAILHRDKATITREYVVRGRLTPVGQLPGKNGALLFSRQEVEALAVELAEKDSTEVAS